jgi:hypothetical protein
MLGIKANKRLDMMKGLKYKLDRKSGDKLYVIYPATVWLWWHSLCWHLSCWPNYFEQNNYRGNNRIITGATTRSDVQLLYEETAWSRLNEQRKAHVLNMVYKIMNNLTPSYLYKS